MFVVMFLSSSEWDSSTRNILQAARSSGTGPGICCYFTSEEGTP